MQTAPPHEEQAVEQQDATDEPRFGRSCCAERARAWWGDHCRMADEQPGDDVPCRTAPLCGLVEAGPGHLAADRRDDCRPYPQQPVQLDLMHRLSTCP